MRAPPAVSVRTGGGPLWHALQMILPALAAAVVALWGGLHLGWPGGALAAAAVFGAAAAAWLAHRARVTLSLPDAELRFDGSGWTLAGTPGRPEVALDLQRWLLLRFSVHREAGAGRLGRVRWVAVSAADAGAALHALRVALYATADPARAADPADPADPARVRPATAPPAADR